MRFSVSAENLLTDVYSMMSKSLAVKISLNWKYVSVIAKNVPKLLKVKAEKAENWALWVWLCSIYFITYHILCVIHDINGLLLQLL